MYKTIPLEEVLAALPAERRAAIEAKGQELLAKIDQRATLAEMHNGWKTEESRS